MPAAFARRLLGGWRRALPAPLVRWLQRPSAARRRQWGISTKACAETLLQFGRTSDQAFTTLAQGLAQLNQNIAFLQEHSAQFQLVIEDRDAERPMASAREVYKRSVDLVHSSIGIAVSEQEQMHGIEKALLAALAAGDSFRRNQLLLRIITMRIRMEASHMDPDHQAIFQNVGDAIGDITRKIAASTEAAFGRIEGVVAETRTERNLLQSIERDLHARAQSSISTIQQELEKLQGSLAPCSAHGRNIAELFARTAPLRLRTLSSLQHQDIVRQQLEHVAAGFLDMHQHIVGDGRGTTRLETGYIHHAAGVQQAHLRSARAEIERATAEVVGGLQAMQEVSQALVESFGQMEAAGLAAFADFRIVVMFREEISQLSSVADKCKETNGNISRLVVRIEEVVRVFAGEVSQHELDVKIVALNAQIAAARVPAADALSRLAEETTRVSQENTAVTRTLVTDLQGSLDRLRGIKASADEFLGIVTVEKAELELGVADVTAKLTRLSARVQADVIRVRQDYEASHQGTATMLGQLGLGPMIERSFPAAEALCTEFLAASTGSADRSQLSTEATARLESHRDRYTMEKENATHAAVIATAAAAPAAAANGLLEPARPAPAPTTGEPVTGNATVSPAAAENLGDGIELF